MRPLRIYSKFEICHPATLTVVIMLYMASLALFKILSLEVYTLSPPSSWEVITSPQAGVALRV